MSCVVFDFGKTHTKRLVVHDDGSIGESEVVDSRWRTDGPYPHCDVEPMWQWMLASLAAIADKHAIEQIVCVSHGAAMALLDDAGLALPILDYESALPQSLAADYARVAPPYDETLTPMMAAGLNLGLQTYWLEATFPEDFARVRHIVGLPQYWAWRLTNAAACDFSCIGAHSHLWNPRSRSFSSLATARGWDRLVAPLCHSYDAVGELRSDVAATTGLSPTCTVLAGGHDSSVVTYLYRHHGFSSFSIASTGTWVVLFNTHADLDRLDAGRDMFVCVTPEGDPLATAMFMGGRELEILSGGAPGAIALADIEAVIAAGSFALPAFAEGGFVKGSPGRIIGPTPTTERERVALGTLYAVLMTAEGLDLLSSENDLIVDGGMTASDALLATMAALRADQRTSVNRMSLGAAMGAACLAFRGTGKQPFFGAIEPVEAPLIPGLHEYAATWRNLALMPDAPSAQRAGKD